MSDLSPRDRSGFDAVVVAHRRLDHPLWDSGASDLGGALEERLHGVVVTTATLGGNGPRVRDAVGAARFAGASAALVVVPDATAAREVVREMTSLPFRVVVSPSWSVDAILEVLETGVGAMDHRACA